MKELIVFGTGNATVTKCYNTCFAIHEGEEYFMVDAGGGNGILSILEQEKIALNKIHTLFVTHSHTDHILGVIWILRMIIQKMMAGKYEGNLTIYGHKELLEKIKTICELTLQKKQVALIGDRVCLVEVKNEETKQILGEDVTFFDIYSSKEKQFGFSMKLEGKTLTCLGDEPFNEKCEKFIKDADWVLCEAFCLYQDREIHKPYEKYHSTVKDAAEIAENMGVKNLVLWHTEDTDLAGRKQAYTEEAKEYYHGNIYVPNDRERIELVR